MWGAASVFGRHASAGQCGFMTVGLTSLSLSLRARRIGTALGENRDGAGENRDGAGGE